MEEKLRILVVDDSVVYRRAVSGLLAELPNVEVAGTAPNGKIALQKLEQGSVDLLLLDIEMPEVDGLEVLRRLQAAGSTVGAIVLSGQTTRGAQSTLLALELGAFDFLLKPTGGSIEQSLERLRLELKPRLAAFARARQVSCLLGAARSTGRSPAPVKPAADREPNACVRPLVAGGKPEVVAIGISTGGPRALAEMLPALPADLAAPVLIVQHMPPIFTRSLADDLNERCKLRVCEAVDGQDIEVGTILIAPGGRQMRVERSSPHATIRITDDPPEHSCRPSVDYLFRSVAAAYGGNSVGVIMTGMGNDGSAGCRLLKQYGGKIIAQNAATCVVFGMPRELVEQGIADVVAPLNQMAAEIVRFVGRVRPACG